MRNRLAEVNYSDGIIAPRCHMVIFPRGGAVYELVKDFGGDYRGR